MITFHLDGRTVGSIGEGDELLRQLSTQSKAVEVRSEEGQVLGRFIPGQEAIVPWDPSITREEVYRRANAPGGTSIAELWKKLGVE